MHAAARPFYLRLVKFGCCASALHRRREHPTPVGVQRHPFPAAAIYIDAMHYVATVAAGFA
jgi:hypothetical protein